MKKMRVAVWIAAVAALGAVLGQGPARAQRPAPANASALPASCEPGPLLALARWVASKGKPETLPPYVLGVAAADPVPVVQMGYRNTETGASHALDLDTGGGRCDLVFILDDGAEVTTWVSDTAGTPERTFFMVHGAGDDKGNRLVPNSGYAAQFAAIKSYFQEKMLGPRERFVEVGRSSSVESQANTHRWPIWRFFYRLIHGKEAPPTDW